MCCHFIETNKKFFLITNILFVVETENMDFQKGSLKLLHLTIETLGYIFIVMFLRIVIFFKNWFFEYV